MKEINKDTTQFEYHVETSRPYGDSEFKEAAVYKVEAVLNSWGEAGWEQAVDVFTGETVEPDVTVTSEGKKINVYLQRELSKRNDRRLS